MKNLFVRIAVFLLLGTYSHNTIEAAEPIHTAKLMVNTHYLNSLDAAQSIHLSKYEKKKFSQNGEDGVIRAIFSFIGTTNKYYVEFGVEDGIQCNTRNLREKFGWTGLMMDGSHENTSINLHKEFITAENINELFQKYQVPTEFDLLSIDIDYNDFYIWYALENYKPRVVVIEYNATHQPNEDKVAMYNPTYMWDFTNYFGASILALKRLGNLKGYTLVYAEKQGVNLFFIRKDVIEGLPFYNADKAKKLYAAPRYGNGPNHGHPRDRLQREFLTSEQAIEYISHFIKPNIGQ
jgi:hypothetical protein